MEFLPSSMLVKYDGRAHRFACSYCGKANVRSTPLDEIEEYVGIIKCEFCGGDTPLDAKRHKPREHSERYYTCGFEVEFFIQDPVNAASYDRRVEHYLDDRWGFDGRSSIVKEYRSDVYADKSRKEVVYNLLYHLNTVLTEIGILGGELKPFKIVNRKVYTAGIHLSFGGNFLGSERWLTEQLDKFLGYKNGIRRLVVEKIRKDPVRFEYRLFSSSLYSIGQIRKFVNQF